MALSEAILICLTDRPMSGYDLAKSFDASIGFFWRASHQQIYRELAKLREKGHVESQEIKQSGKPNRIVHTITDSGKKALMLWSTKPCKQPSSKDDLLIKFYALNGVDIPSFVEQLQLRLEQHQTKLQKYNRIRANHFEGKALPLNQKGKLIALDLGIEQESQQIVGITRTIEEIRAL